MAVHCYSLSQGSTASSLFDIFPRIVRNKPHGRHISLRSASDLSHLKLSKSMANPVAGAPEEEEAVYSVWALPPDDVRDRLKRLMSALRSEFGGPEFNPHITVVGDTRLSAGDALQSLRASATSLRPYTARIASAASGTFFYQCVYLVIEPTEEVVEASSHCCGHFDYKRSTPYMPHLSLLYGDLTDEEKGRARQRVEELGKDILGLSFEISEIALWKTDTEDKSLESWEKVEVCYLGSEK